MLATTRKTLDGDRDTLQRFVAAVQDGARAELTRPRRRRPRTSRRRPTRKDLGLVRAQLAAVRPILDPTLRLNRAVLERWAAFAEQIGLLDGRPDVGKTFDFTLAR